MDQYSTYDLSEDDPYLIQGSECLNNNLGLTDTQSLNEAEKEFSLIAMAELVEKPVPPTFDFEHLKSIHKRLFEDIYPFAGIPRTVEIAKGNMLFLPYGLIDEMFHDVSQELSSESHLENLPIDQFAARLGYYLGKINMIHAFREGNGRSQRIFLDQLAEHNGFDITWSSISNSGMAEACRAARNEQPDYMPLQKLLAMNLIKIDID